MWQEVLDLDRLPAPVPGEGISCAVSRTRWSGGGNGHLPEQMTALPSVRPFYPRADRHYYLLSLVWPADQLAWAMAMQ